MEQKQLYLSVVPGVVTPYKMFDTAENDLYKLLRSFTRKLWMWHENICQNSPLISEDRQIGTAVRLDEKISLNLTVACYGIYKI